MKNKLLGIVTVILAGIMAMGVNAGAAGMAVYDAAKADDCKNGKAVLEVQYKENAPVMDGVVNEDEYFEIPYEKVADYYSYYVGAAFDTNQNNEYKKLLSYAENSMHTYACWDGQYFYFAIVGKASKNEYNCPEVADSSYMYRYSCAQFGFAAPDAVEKDRFEIGLGASSSTPGDSYCYPSWGTRSFKSFKNGESYCSKWDADQKQVTYEVRVDIGEVIGTTPKDGCQMRFTYLVAKSGTKNADGSDRLQIQCSYGIADEKHADWYMMVTFKGLNKEISAATAAPTDSEGEELDFFWGKTDFRDEDSMALFTITKNADVAHMKDANGEGFIRITATGDSPIVGGKKLPIGLNAKESGYVAIRYRTNSPLGEYLGISYSIEQADSSLPVCYSRANNTVLATNGEWHTVVFNLTDETNWIMNWCFWPFANKENATGETFDIQWIKYFSENPSFTDIYDPNATPAPTADGEGTSSKGCFSSISSISVLIALGASVAVMSFGLKKKEQ